MNAQDWITTLAPFDTWNERVIMAAFALLGKPRAYLDIGSGTGAMVNLARKIGIPALGVDALPRPDDWLKVQDLREPFDLGGVFDLVTCIEVAEHIPIENDATLCNSIARHVAPGGWLIFTAAHPGQGGEQHVNLRPAPYWRKMFYDRGLDYSMDVSLKLAHIWQCTETPQYWLIANCQVFRKWEGAQ